VADLDLVIPRDGRFPVNGPVDISKLQVRPTDEQLNIALGQTITLGEVTTLNDPRFSRENSSKGLWRPFDFLWENNTGIYFLEPYQSDKIPVLFVHGINGTPLDFSYFIEKLDRSRFQAWVFYYPSGMRLDSVAAYLDQMVIRLRTEYRFRQLLVVAHSLGGLVARSFILREAEADDNNLIPLFVSIATPWNGHNAARLGVKYAPHSIPVWHDLAPGSNFLTRLFYRGKEPNLAYHFLPASTAYHLIFAFLPTESGDGTIALTSQLRWEAQQEAAHLYGISQSHAGVLSDPRTAELLNQLLSGVTMEAPMLSQK
jgi:pimeloyl-ACP methyl ester carboxylesterase